MDDVEAYAEETASSIFYLTLEACGVRNESADHAASHLGGLLTCFIFYL